MECSQCGLPLSSIEVQDATGLCMRCELLQLRAYKKKEEEQLKKLIGSPVYEDVINDRFYMGCKLNPWAYRLNQTA
jgi:hypothetical protein